MFTTRYIVIIPIFISILFLSQQLHCLPLTANSEPPVIIPIGFLYYSDTPDKTRLNTNIKLGDQGKNHSKIRTIRFSTLNVYPDEKGESPGFPYSLINFLHIRTRLNVVSREMLLNIGDDLDTGLLEETERNLRSLGCFRQARISYESNSDGSIDVDVRTIDNWTTKVFFSLKRVGSVLSGSFGIREDNILGLGKQVVARYSFHPDRNNTNFLYYDPYLFGNTLSTRLEYDVSEDQKKYGISVWKPFSSQLSRWSSGISLDREERLETNDIDNSNAHSEIIKTNHDQRIAKTFVAFSPSTTHSCFYRYRLAYRFENALRDVSDPRDSDEDVDDTAFTRSQSNIEGVFEVMTYDYIRERNICRYGRDEDFNLGFGFQLEGNYTSKDLGAGTTDFELAGRLTKGFGFNNGHFVLGTIKTGGHYQENDIRGVSTNVEFNHYVRLLERLTLANRILAGYYGKTDVEDNFKLGAEQGLTGYKLDCYTGNKGLLYNFEARILIFDDFLKLCTIGAVIFFDAGNAWKQNEDLDVFRLHTDAGVGLRFSFPRTSSGGIFKVSYSYAFDDNGLDDRWLLSFGAATTF